MPHPFTILLGNCLYKYMERAARIYSHDKKNVDLLPIQCVGKNVGHILFATKGLIITVLWPKRYHIVQTNIINDVIAVDMEATVTFVGVLDGSMRMYNYDIGEYVTSTDQSIVDDWCAEILEDIHREGGPATYWDAPSLGKAISWPKQK